MADFGQAKKRIYTALIAMGVLSVASMVVLLTPLTGSSNSRLAELQQLDTTLRDKTREVVPLRGIDKKIVEARGEINDFYGSRFPAEQSSVPEALGKIASAHSVKMDLAKYESKTDPKAESRSEGKDNIAAALAVGLHPVQVEAAFSGSYPNMMRFINDLERSKTFFLLNSVSLGESQGGEVKLQLKLETYVKAGA